MSASVCEGYARAAVPVDEGENLPFPTKLDVYPGRFPSVEGAMASEEGGYDSEYVVKVLLHDNGERSVEIVC